jgi:hypothetical protein
VPFLLKGSDAALKKIAEADAATPADPQSQAALGDLWSEYTSKPLPAPMRYGVLERARFWYFKAQPALSGLAKAKVEKRIGELGQQLSLKPSTSGTAAGVELSPKIPWEKAKQNEFRISRTGNTDTTNLAQFVYGTTHPELHNPQAFVVNALGPCKFEFKVVTVSGYGGAKLEILVDDKRAPLADLSNNLKGNPKEVPVEKVYEVALPRGLHRVTIGNTGTDWAKVAWYKFSGQLGD